MEEEEDDSMVAKCPASLYVMSPAGKEWWHICTVWRLEERRKGRQKKDNEQKGPLGTVGPWWRMTFIIPLSRIIWL